MKRIIWILLAIAVFGSCENSTSPSTSAETPVPIHNAKYDGLGVHQIEWKTVGGGEIHFRILWLETCYLVSIFSYSYEEMNESILVTPEETDIFALISKLFSREYDLNQGYSSTSGDATGSWTTVIVTYNTGDVQEIPKNPVFDGFNMDALYSFVVGKLTE